MKRKLLILATIVGMDQLFKVIIRQYPNVYAIYTVTGFIRIRHSTNTGMAFSLFAEHTTVLVLLSIVLLVTICLFVNKTMRLTKAAETAYICLLSGGIGNLIDRMFFGEVTDYIELLFFSFPVFNLADVVITLSVLTLLVLIIIGKHEESSGEENGTDY